MRDEALAVENEYLPYFWSALETRSRLLWDLATVRTRIVGYVVASKSNMKEVIGRGGEKRAGKTGPRIALKRIMARTPVTHKPILTTSAVDSLV